ncbi:MAG: hypothetical protein QJR04_25370 [Burkholderia multivorans]|nr:hypothetical protein [Burkholderia multivorans]
MMVGTPIKNQRDAALDAREDEIFDWIENGDTLYDIARRAGVHRGALTRWLNRTEERTERFARARARAADNIADDARRDADELVKRAELGMADKVDAAAVKLATDVKRWTAGVWNRDRYGEQRGPSVTINLAGLHLDALRQAQAALRPAERAAEALPRADVIDVEASDVRDAAPQPLRLEDLL